MTKSFRIALAGNPNTGKSTLFNLLTGLKQHTGNWAGKTVDLKTGIFSYKAIKYEMIDLPGTYSLFSNSMDEKIARDQIIICINLIDEAEKLGIYINDRILMNRLGVPVIKISARNKTGISMLLDTIDRVVSGMINCTPYQVTYDEETEQKINLLIPNVKKISGDQFPARWLSLRLLDGDRELLQKIEESISKMEV